MFAARSACWAQLAIGLALMGGCPASRPAARVMAPLASATPYLDDIPLPVGFALVDQASEDWSSGSLRYVRHRYRGRSDKHAIRVFYREQMVLVRWTPLSESRVGGRCVMSFERGAESCTVTLDGSGSGRAGSVTVEVLIAPKANRAGDPGAQTR